MSSLNLNLICDVCGREVMGCTFVNGMKFCAKCYQETFGNKNNMTENLNNMYDAYSKILAEKDAKISDLEAKLAKKEEQVRKKVCEQIRELTKKQTDFGFIDEKIALYKLFNILDEVEKGG